MILQAIDVTKSFEIEGHAVDALKGVSLKVARGESVALVGNSGAGKSTLLHILGALELPTSGEVLFDGKSLVGDKSDAIREEYRKNHVGFVFQFHHLIAELTARENVMLPLRMQRVNPAEAQSLADSWLTAVGLAHRLDHRPSEMSGGEQQRVAVARALVRQPAIVFTDEPTGNLDGETGETIGDLLFSLCKENNSALVIVTHNAELAAKADRQLTMKNGVFTA